MHGLSRGGLISRAPGGILVSARVSRLNRCYPSGSRLQASSSSSSDLEHLALENLARERMLYDEARASWSLERETFLEREKRLFEEITALREALVEVATQNNSSPTNSAGKFTTNTDYDNVDKAALSSSADDEAQVIENSSWDMRAQFETVAAATETTSTDQRKGGLYQTPDADSTTQASSNGAEATTETVPIPDTWRALVEKKPAVLVGCEDVATMTLVHHLLGQCGYWAGDDDEDDMIFGAGTEDALRYFQACNGVSESGLVDVDTWNALLRESGFADRLAAEPASPIGGADEEVATTSTTVPPPSMDKGPLTGQGGLYETPSSSSSTRRDSVMFTDDQLNSSSPTPPPSTTTTTTTTKGSSGNGTVPGKPLGFTYASETVLRPVLRPEDGGPDVREMQAALSRAGYSCGDDDMEYWFFGMQTEETLKYYQSSAGLPESGVCCASTWISLIGEEVAAFARNDKPGVDPGGLDDEFGNDLCRADGEDCNFESEERGVWLIGEQRWEKRSTDE